MDDVAERCLLIIEGDLDIASVGHCRDVATVILDTAAANGHRMIIDMAGVTFIDSTGLGCLVSVQNEATERRRQGGASQRPGSGQDGAANNGHGTGVPNRAVTHAHGRHWRVSRKTRR